MPNYYFDSLHFNLLYIINEYPSDLFQDNIYITKENGIMEDGTSLTQSTTRHNKCIFTPASLGAVVVFPKDQV